MANPELSTDQLVAAMRNLSDVERATVYAESIPTPEPISFDDLKTMTPQQIVAAHQAGQLDHLAADKAARKQQVRDDKAARSTARVHEDNQRRINSALGRSLGAQSHTTLRPPAKWPSQ